MRHVMRPVVDPCLVLLELSEQAEQLTLSRGDLAMQEPDPFDQGPGVVGGRRHERPFRGRTGTRTPPTLSNVCSDVKGSIADTVAFMASPAATIEVQGREIRVSNPDKVYFPDAA